MNKIRVLSDKLANQIAAGEVVERPASVVKELIENAIDAGATRVQVDIELGGRRMIRISDDGEGMTRDDAILAFERHATSKIRQAEDLGAIRTLGFRGEALASIASVAKVELLTKRPDEKVATRVVIEGSRLVDVKDAARDTGTTIAVRDLFFNTPARRKFMRSEATENYHLTSIATHYALAHPEMAFTLTNNGRDVIRISPARDLRERAFQIFGRDLMNSLLVVDGGREYVAKVTGFVSAPRERRTTRDSQYFFVNNRFVRDKTIAGGLAEGYRSVLPHGVYPVVFLFLDIPVEEIDVNVHPAKTEVRFRRGEAVKEVVADAVRQALASAGIRAEQQAAAAYPERLQPPTARSLEPLSVVPPLEQGRIEFRHKPASQRDESGDLGEAESHPSPLPTPRREFVEPVANEVAETDDAFFVDKGIEVPEERLQPAGYAEMPPVDSALKIAKPVEVETVSYSAIKPLGQMHDSFIVAVDDEGLLLIDQHVAHERILFDKFRRSESDRGIESQNLLLPETFDLTPAQSEALSLIEPDLEALGFRLMRLSGRTLAIKSIPTDIQPSEARNLFAEILDTVDAEKKGAPKSTFRDSIAASLACKAAVKINMKLTTEKIAWMIDRLLVTTSPTTCPHGRPVILRLSMKDIERAFHRS